MTNIAPTVKNGVSTNGKPATHMKIASDETGRNLESAAIAQLLEKHGYTFRLRDMDDGIEVNGKMLDNGIFAKLHVLLHDNDYKNESYIRSVLYTIAAKNTFNPITEYLNECKRVYDGHDHIKDLADCFTDNSDLIRYENGKVSTTFHAFIYRWLIGSVGKSFNYQRNRLDDYWQNPVVLLGGEMGIGKSNFVSWLASDIPNYYIEDMFNLSDKELDRKLCSYFIMEMSEAIKTLSKSDHDDMKFKITQKRVKFRVPYARELTDKPICANIIGTFNDNGKGLFNKEEIGNGRRWRILELTTINEKKYQKMDIKQIWGQAFTDYLLGEKVWLSPEEESVRQANLGRFTTDSTLEDYIQRYFILDKKNKSFFMRTSEMIDILRDSKYKVASERALQMEINSVLRRLGFDSNKAKRDNQNGYWGITPRGDSNPNVDTKLEQEIMLLGNEPDGHPLVQIGGPLPFQPSNHSPTS